MKTTILKSLVLLACVLSNYNLKSERIHLPYYDTSYCLQIEGRLKYGENVKGDCLVELVSYNQIIDSIRLRPGCGKFRFLLKRNTSYTIRISKHGHIVKLVCVDTTVPFEQEGIFRFRFNTKMMDHKTASTLNTDALDFPVALIYYDNKENCFEYSKEYTNRIKREWYKSEPAGLLSLNSK